MKITKSKLKQIIKEEYNSMLSEGRGPRDPEDPRQPYKPGGPFEVPRPEPYKPEDSVGDKIDPKDLKEQAGSIENDLMHMLNDAKALGQKMDAVKKKMYKAGKWNRTAATLAGYVYAVERAIEDYLKDPSYTGLLPDD